VVSGEFAESSPPTPAARPHARLMWLSTCGGTRMETEAPSESGAEADAVVREAASEAAVRAVAARVVVGQR